MFWILKWIDIIVMDCVMASHILGSPGSVHLDFIMVDQIPVGQTMARLLDAGCRRYRRLLCLQSLKFPV